MRKIYGDNDEKILTVSRKSHANTPLRPSLYLDGGIQGVHRAILTPIPQFMIIKHSGRYALKFKYLT